MKRAADGDRDVRRLPRLGGLVRSDVTGWDRLPVVNACVRLVAQLLASMPIRVVDEKGKDMPVPDWLRYPYETYTIVDLISSAVWSLLMVGNWYPIPRRAGGEIVAVWPLRPNIVTATVPVGGGFEYRVNGRLWSGEMFHARYACIPGDPMGYSAIAAAASNIEISSSAQSATVRHLVRGMSARYAITAPADMSSEDMDVIQEELDIHFQGVVDGDEALFLRAGLGLMPVSMTAQDGALLALMQYSDAQIAAMVFGVDPQMMGIVEKAGSSLTYKNLQDQLTALHRNTVLPLEIQIQNVLSQMLPPGQYVDLDERGMLQGSLKDRSEMVAKMPGGVFTVNERRALLDYPPVEGGDELASATPPPPPPPPPAADGGEPDDGMVDEEDDDEQDD